MRIYLILSFLLVALECHTQDVFEQTTVKFQENTFYSVKGENNSKLLIFLHGGVTNPAFDNGQDQPELSFLLEGNEDLLSIATKNQIDLLVPVKNDEFNWLTNHDQVMFILKWYLESNNNYKEIYLSGFSDGGTGSYKIFYDNHGFFNGLLVFNGFPQDDNFNQTVDYTKVNNQKVLFFSTFDDRVIPYEFLLAEYVAQKENNPDTYLYLREGDHSFGNYNSKDFQLAFELLQSESDNIKTDPIHAFIHNDEVLEFYPFRKKIVKEYSYREDLFQLNKKQSKLYNQK